VIGAVSNPLLGHRGEFAGRCGPTSTRNAGAEDGGLSVEGWPAPTRGDRVPVEVDLRGVDHPQQKPRQRHARKVAATEPEEQPGWSVAAPLTQQ
jgi:hypothetical protein